MTTYDAATRKSYPFIDRLEHAFDRIRAEAIALDDGSWSPMPNYPDGWRGCVLNVGPWERDFPGIDFAANRARCPDTTGIVEGIDGLLMTGFLRLAPGITIAPHTDPRDDDVVRYHLGVRIPPPEDAWWPEGRARLMDVRQPHWARNESELPRITLVLDVRMPFVVQSDVFGVWREGPPPP